MIRLCFNCGVLTRDVGGKCGKCGFIFPEPGEFMTCDKCGELGTTRPFNIMGEDFHLCKSCYIKHMRGEVKYNV